MERRNNSVSCHPISGIYVLLKDKLLLGPFDILKPKAFGGNFPMTVSYEAVRDILTVVIHVYFIALMIFLFVWWQKRGERGAKEIEVSTYGRPLVKKS